MVSSSSPFITLTRIRIFPAYPYASAVQKIPVLSITTTKGMSKEEYKLSALPVALITSQPNGFYYGIQTICQLLPPAIFGKRYTG
ncbi:glycoside hydrolase family 20 zincin-like fold domain-containing protein [uncultured Bacteroides sp.]|uniref:glycoside hydrolase family 20 zincin-like fold domain-containing protein n=1 Tax=uncultured Bacteroides sp. TaxID=162156 RepID=UPI00351B05E5